MAKTVNTNKASKENRGDSVEQDEKTNAERLEEAIEDDWHEVLGKGSAVLFMAVLAVFIFVFTLVSAIYLPFVIFG